jgi:deferrochelatase/peroxidase EfeB
VKPARRDLLLGLAGGAIGFGLGSESRAPPAGTLSPGDDGTQDRQPFYGLHQSGVITPQPAAALIASFDVLAEDRASLERLFRTLTERIAFLTQGGQAATLDPKYPPPDNGLLGPAVFPDNLTVTVALGASLFDDRYGLQKLRPARLISMDQFPNDALEAHLCHGDIALQILLEHRRNEYPCVARHPVAHAGPSVAALEDRRFSSSTHNQEARQGDGPQSAWLQGGHRQSGRH